MKATYLLFDGLGAVGRQLASSKERAILLWQHNHPEFVSKITGKLKAYDMANEKPPEPGLSLVDRLKAESGQFQKQNPQVSIHKHMSLEQLCRYTESDLEKTIKADDVVLENARITRSFTNGKAVSALAYSQKEHLKKYVVFIAGFSEESIATQKSVFVTCTCPDFKYRLEYPDTLHGASAIINCNGQPTLRTNPSFRPGLCKHLLALANYIRKNDL